MTTHLLEIQDLFGSYIGSFGVVRGVAGVSLSIDSGEILGLAGESGCGKSTLAELVSGSPPPLLHYESGTILVDGFEIYNIDPEVLRTEVKCQRMSYVPQASMESLNPVKKIGDFVMDVVYERTGQLPEEEEVLEFAGSHFETLGLERDVLGKYPHELSGGMKQRVVIGISTLWNPKLLIIDEPTSALDVTSQRKMTKSLWDLKQSGVIESILYISHDIASLRQLCDRCAIMYCGKLMETGTMDEIINDPKHPYTQGLISSIASYDPENRCEGLTCIPGEHPDLRNPPSGCRFHPRCQYVQEVCQVEEPHLQEISSGHYVRCHFAAELKLRGVAT